jgi:hypothetical protein
MLWRGRLGGDASSAAVGAACCSNYAARWGTVRACVPCSGVGDGCTCIDHCHCNMSLRSSFQYHVLRLRFIYYLFISYTGSASGVYSRCTRRCCVLQQHSALVPPTTSGQGPALAGVAPPSASASACRPFPFSFSLGSRLTLTLTLTALASPPLAYRLPLALSARAGPASGAGRRTPRASARRSRRASARRGLGLVPAPPPAPPPPAP